MDARLTIFLSVSAGFYGIVCTVFMFIDRAMKFVASNDDFRN